MSERVIMQACANCWQPIDEGWAKFCPNCGVDLQKWGRAHAGAYPIHNVLTLTKSPITIGRAKENDVCLDHPAVSATHARLEWRDVEKTWFIVDEHSAKGTFVNYSQVTRGSDGQRVNPEVDTIWIAPYSFRLSSNGEQTPVKFEPAHLRLDAKSLIRTVKHESTGGKVHILDLDQTPLSFRPGEFIALVGGSGAGKSTLMKALLGLAPAQEGTVFVGGQPFIVDGQARRFEAMHSVVGYVPQDDVVHHALTPLEALDYIARFRMSPDLTREERSDYIKRTLTTVELWSHRDKLICKLSGGQRKRVNIALELMAQPRLLFLDEPTSGLDPGLDLSIMGLLRQWATDPADPRTIILVTHATENVTNCKYVAFMAPGGYVVYFGPPEDALTYFGVKRFAEIYRLVGNYQLPELTVSDEESDSEPQKDVRELTTRFQESSDHFHYVSSRQLPAEPVEDPDSGKTRPVTKSSSISDKSARDRFGLQWRTLTARYWKLVRRDRMNFIILLLQGILVAGLLWAVSRPDTFLPKGAENAQTVLFIMACAAVWLGILNATKEIVKEQDIYARERRYGLDAAPYILSKLFVLAGIGAFQIGTMLALISLRITFPEHGALGTWSPTWLEWFVTLELTLVAGLALGLLLSASTKTIDAATAVMFVLLLIQVMFAGLFFPDARWADILSVFTFSRWGLEAAGTTANLNGLLQSAIGSVYQVDRAYSFTPLHLFSRWFILSAFAVLLTSATILRQKRRYS
jgi:ABC transport system ATP-binding/permease protein